MDLLESAMHKNVDVKVRNRFIPYLQLQEFEGLLFNDIEIFYDQIPKNELIGIAELKQTFKDDPEMINDNPETSPSHRLKRINARYDFQ